MTSRPHSPERRLETSCRRRICHRSSARRGSPKTTRSRRVSAVYTRPYRLPSSRVEFLLSSSIFVNSGSTASQHKQESPTHSALAQLSMAPTLTLQSMPNLSLVYMCSHIWSTTIPWQPVLLPEPSLSNPPGTPKADIICTASALAGPQPQPPDILANAKRGD